MRATTNKHQPFMTLHRWLFIIVASLLLLFTVFIIYYRDIQMPKWSAVSDAKAKAIEAAELTAVKTVYHHIWNKESWVVEGVNHEDEKVFVWLTGDKQPETVKAAEGISERELKNTFTVTKPDADVKRIQPGLLNDEPVWEIYYSDGQNPEYFFYDFYKFGNGTFIDSYQLPAKTEP